MHAYVVYHLLSAGKEWPLVDGRFFFFFFIGLFFFSLVHCVEVFSLMSVVASGVTEAKESACVSSSFSSLMNWWRSSCF